MTYERKKIKICYLVSSLCNEGPVNVMHNIIKYMDFSLFDVYVITLTPEKQNSRLDDFEQFPIQIIQLSKEHKLSPLALFKSLKKAVNGIQPDELHVHCPRSLYLMAFLNRQYKRIYTIHIYPGLQQLMLYGKTKGKAIIWLNNYFTKKCDLPIGCAESVGIQYREKKKWEILCIPNGSSLPIWDTNDIEKKNLRREFGLKDNIRYFIYIGRFSKEKNPDILINAFKRINEKNIGLIMLGEGPMWNELRLVKSDNIIMPGFTNRVYDFLKASDFYISVSDVEGLANTLLESLSVGLPMLLSDIPSHREILGNMRDMHTGYIVNNKNIDDIVEKIYEVQKLDEGLVRNTLQKIYQERYTAEIMSKQYQKAYINLLNK